MMNLGHLCLAAAFLFSIAVTLLCALATVQPRWTLAGRRLALALPIPWLAVGIILIWSLCRADFGFLYVSEHVDPTMPLRYRLAALWSGQEGSLLIWATALSLVCAGVSATLRGVTRRSALVSIAVLAAVVLGMGLILVTGADPFRRSTSIISRPNQQLRHWAMLIHPPLIFLGYSLCAAPCAIAVGALTSRRQAGRWVAALRPWAIGAWLTLGTGIVLGAWWAYTQLGWGGYWAWDPVENSSLIPFLTLTALLHCIALHRRRRVLSFWTAALALTAFVLCVFGTFVTRGGIIESIHAFGRSTIGAYLAALLAALVISAAVLLITRRARFTTDSLRAPESLVMAGTLLLTFAAAAVFVGTSIPLFAPLFSHAPASVGRNFYESTVGPCSIIAAALMAVSPAFVEFRPGVLRRRLLVPAVLSALLPTAAALMGLHSIPTLAFIWVCALTLWMIGAAFVAKVHAKSSAHRLPWLSAARITLLSDHRLYGGRLAHIGMGILLAGVCASSLLARTWDVSLHPGEARDLGSCILTLNRVDDEQSQDSLCVRADIALRNSDGEVWSMSPRRCQYHLGDQAVAQVAIRSTLLRDVYVGLSAWDDSKNSATIHLRVLPGLLWIWIGAGLVAAGGAVCLAPVRRPAALAVRATSLSLEAPGPASQTPPLLEATT